MIYRFYIDYKITGKDSTNSIYAGKHWSTRNNYANTIKPLIISALNKCNINKSVKKNITKPIFIGFLFPNDRIDIDNHSYFKKVVIDCLKGRAIHDDTKKYVLGTMDSFYDGDKILVTFGHHDDPIWIEYMMEMGGIDSDSI